MRMTLTRSLVYTAAPSPRAFPRVLAQRKLSKSLALHLPTPQTYIDARVCSGTEWWKRQQKELFAITDARRKECAHRTSITKWELRMLLARSGVCVASTIRHQDDAECGIMQAVTTISHNDNCADLLAVVRRGPGARPTEEELIEYLIPGRNGRRNVLQRSITLLSMS